MSKLALKKLVKQLASIKGRHTELVSVYVPVGANLHEIVNQLRNEQSTAENIKSKPVRKNVVSALDKIIRELQMFKKTPPNGLALFAGNISEKEGTSDIEVWTVEPPDEVRVKMYWCDQNFVLEPLMDMIKEKQIYGIICLDKSEADIAMLRGKKLEPIVHFDSIVPGKTRAGGQCFSRDTTVKCLSESKDIINKNIDEVKENDKVVCYDTETKQIKISSVKRKFIKKINKIYKIETDTTKIRTTGAHVFFVSNKAYLKEKAASDLAKGEFLVAVNPDGKTAETKIISINEEHSKPATVFDLSVERYENFVANNLLVHNSSARFSRVREGMLNDWLKHVGEAANKIFEEHAAEVLGIIVSGSGPIKEMFMKEDYMHAQVKVKVIGIVDTSYTGDFGLQETIEKSDQLLKEEEVTKEKKLLQQFFTELQKSHGRVSYGIQDVVKSTESGAVDRIIVSEATPLKAYELVNDTGEKKIIFSSSKPVEQGFDLMGEQDLPDYLEDLADSYGSRVIIISNDTREGQQFLELGGVGALLRYNI